MGAPCINDTCSITSSIDPITRRLQIDTRIDPTGGLHCIDGRGIGVEILGDPDCATALDQCYQQLGVSCGGELWSIPKRAKFHTFDGTVVNIPQGTDEGDESSSPIGSVSIENPYDCQAALLVMGRFEVGYTISYTDSESNQTENNPVIKSETDAGAVNNDPGDSYVPFNADIKCALSIDAVNAAVTYMDIGGIIPINSGPGLNNSNKRRWEYFMFRRSIAAGDTLVLRASSNHEGTNESINIKTIDADGSLPDRGFNIRGSVILFPFNNEAL